MNYKTTEYVRAIQWNTNNLEEIRSFFKDDNIFIEKMGDTLCVGYRNHVYTCHVNDYIVIDDRERMQIVPSNIFEQRYVEITNNASNVFNKDYKLEEMKTFVEDLSNASVASQYLLYSRFKNCENNINERAEIIRKYFSNCSYAYHDATIVTDRIAVVTECFKDQTFYFGIDRTRDTIPYVAFKTFEEALVYAMALCAGNEDINAVQYITRILNVNKE